MGGGWVLEVDIQSFFDALDHRHLREILDQRVRDGVLLRLIGKWLQGGRAGRGATQALRDRHAARRGDLAGARRTSTCTRCWTRGSSATCGRGSMGEPSSSASPTTSCCASRMTRTLGASGPCSKRFGRYGLTIHPEKTRLVPFRRPPRGSGADGGSRGNRPGTFDLLGFTHYRGRSRRGTWVIRRKTMSSRLSRSLRAVWTWCRSNRHQPLDEQHEQLSRKLRGHYAYYGITGNGPGICAFRHGPTDLALVAEPPLASHARRAGRTRPALGAVSAAQCCGGPLRVPHVANLRPEEPDAVVPHVRICGGRGEQSPSPTRPPRARASSRPTRSGTPARRGTPACR